MNDKELSRRLIDPYNPENFTHGDRTSEDWVLIGDRDVENYNWYQAAAAYKLAERPDKLKQLARKTLYGAEVKGVKTTPNPTRAFLIADELGDKALLKEIRDQADKKKLELLRDFIDKQL